MNRDRVLVGVGYLIEQAHVNGKPRTEGLRWLSDALVTVIDFRQHLNAAVAQLTRRAVWITTFAGSSATIANALEQSSNFTRDSSLLRKSSSE